MSDNPDNSAPVTIDSFMVEKDDTLNFSTVSIGDLPAVGDLKYESEDGKMLVFDGTGGGSWKAITPPTPTWEHRYYVMKGEVHNEEVYGVFHTIEDTSADRQYSMWCPGQSPEFRACAPERIEKNEYETHVAFETFPVLEVFHQSAGGSLLKRPTD